MFKKFLLLLFFLFFVSTGVARAQTLPSQLNYKETFVQGKILDVLPQDKQTVYGTTTITQKFKVRLLQGKEKGREVTVKRSFDPKFAPQNLSAGETIIVNVQNGPNNLVQYSVYDPYRLNSLIYFAIFFMLLIIFIAGRKGVGSIVGLLVSFAIIGFWIIPSILRGEDPLTVSILGAAVILIFTTYIAHGISLKTTAAIIGTAISLVFAGWLAKTAVSFLSITGLGNESIYNLQVGTSFSINPQGLLLGGILIGTLGALNDITTTQSITMFTLVKENPKQKLIDLFEKGMTIGKEHIASLINTLVLAYVGSSLAILIAFELNPAHLPWWVILNNESTIQEIAKSLVGASALILAVPITTILSAWIAKKRFT